MASRSACRLEFKRRPAKTARGKARASPATSGQVSFLRFDPTTFNPLCLKQCKHWREDGPQRGESGAAEDDAGADGPAGGRVPWKSGQSSNERNESRGAFSRADEFSAGGPATPLGMGDVVGPDHR